MQQKGNYNTGDFTFLKDGKKMLSVNLLELNQNTEWFYFQPSLAKELNEGLERAYNSGYRKAQKDMNEKLDSVINNEKE